MYPENVLLLNADYRPLKVITWQRAINLLLKDVVVSASERYYRIRSAFEEFKLPTVVALKKYVTQATSVKLSRVNVFRRDEYQCQYCGTRNGKMTVDHVVPKAKGGLSTWDNLVTACHSCNNKKGSKLLEDTGFTLRRPPKKPRSLVLLRSSVARLGWDAYLPTT